MKKSNIIITLDYIFAALFLAAIIYMYEVRQTPASTVSVAPAVPAGQVEPVEQLSLLFARTDEERELGLGDRMSLPADEGMLFVFETPEKYAFWMKDMSFPIDMIWLDADFRIVYIASDVSPSTYPEEFSPTAPSSYVLETNAGYAAKNNLSVGETLDFVKTQVGQ